MPPWHIDRNVGITKFKDDPSLTDSQVKTIAKWVDDGAPMGNPATAGPAQVTRTNQNWFIGKPDIIVKMDKPNLLRRTGPTTSWTC